VFARCVFYETSVKLVSDVWILPDFVC